KLRGKSGPTAFQLAPPSMLLYKPLLRPDVNHAAYSVSGFCGSTATLCRRLVAPEFNVFQLPPPSVLLRTPPPPPLYNAPEPGSIAKALATPPGNDNFDQLSPPLVLLNKPPRELSTLVYNVFGFCWSTANKPIRISPPGEPNPIRVPAPSVLLNKPN